MIPAMSTAARTQSARPMTPARKATMDLLAIALPLVPVLAIAIWSMLRL